MTRETLFRGKQLNNGEWVYGSYWYSHRSNTYQHFVFDDGNVWVGVEPDTVGQFTGLTDKNGVKIFDGDVIEYTDGCNDWLGAVKYASDDAQFVARFIGGDVESFDNLYIGDCEVIGNIYDNPELFYEGET
mgnify:FL=1